MVTIRKTKIHLHFEVNLTKNTFTNSLKLHCKNRLINLKGKHGSTLASKTDSGLPKPREIYSTIPTKEH